MLHHHAASGTHHSGGSDSSDRVVGRGSVVVGTPLIQIVDLDDHTVGACELCGYGLWLPIARLQVCSVGLYDDANSPGRCLVPLNRHYRDLLEMPSDLFLSYMDEVQTIARAIRKAMGADTVDMAVFGNKEHHVGTQLIPRCYTGIEWPMSTPWHRQPSQDSMGHDAVVRTVTAIQAALLDMR